MYFLRSVDKGESTLSLSLRERDNEKRATRLVIDRFTSDKCSMHGYCSARWLSAVMLVVVPPKGSFPGCLSCKAMDAGFSRASKIGKRQAASRDPACNSFLFLLLPAGAGKYKYYCVLRGWTNEESRCPHVKFLGCRAGVVQMTFPIPSGVSDDTGLQMTRFSDYLQCIII
jgi:hypothetical protein